VDGAINRSFMVLVFLNILQNFTTRAVSYKIIFNS